MGSIWSPKWTTWDPRWAPLGPKRRVGERQTDIFFFGRGHGRVLGVTPDVFEAFEAIS